MVQHKFYGVYVHGSFVNEAFFQLLGGVKRDPDGQVQSVAGYSKDQDGVVRAPPHNVILDPLRRLAVSGLDLAEDKSPQARQFEQRVLSCLQRIDKSLVGSSILQSMVRSHKVIIVPYNSFDTLHAGPCNARTMNKMSFGGYIRVAFTPDDACASDDVAFPQTEDETLLHELFHAYLATADKSNDYWDTMEESSSQEEFLAVQVTNMYRAESGRGVFQRVYGAGSGPTKQPTSVTRSQLEAYLQSDERVLNVLNPEGIGLFQCLGKYTSLPFNPFRNWSQWRQKLFEFRYRIRQDLKGANKPGPKITPIWE